jgi:phage head maturation protease
MLRLDQHARVTSTAPAPLLLRELAGELEVREAMPRPTTWDPTARTIEAVIATDARVARRDQAGEFDEVLDPATLDLTSARGVSVLNSHQQGGVGNVIGVCEAVRREGNSIVATLRFSDRADVQPIVADIASGIIRSLSIGYNVASWRDGTANGRRTKTAAAWAVREISFVPVPADPNARTRSLPARGTDNRAIRELGHRAGAQQSVIDALIDRGASVAEATTTFMSDMIGRSVPIRSAHNDQTRDYPEVMRRALADALYHRIAPTSTPSPQARQYLGLSIRDAAAECLRGAGATVMGLSPSEIITRALNTTSDFPLLMSDLMGRTVVAAYAAPPSGIRALARAQTAADFRTRHRLQFDASGIELRPLNEHGEYQSGSPVEGEETYKLSTFGRMVGFTRQALINDDLAQLSDIGARLSGNAIEFESKFLVDLLVGAAGLGRVMKDGKTVFHLDHRNLATAAAPSETTLSAMRLAMRRQTGLAGTSISVIPKFLLVPPELETLGEKLLTAIQAATTDTVNPFASKLSLVVENRLLNPLRYYIVADGAPDLEYCRLSGAPGPVVESQAGWRIDGIETKVRLDFGGGWVSWQGWQTSAGGA